MSKLTHLLELAEEYEHPSGEGSMSPSEYIIDFLHDDAVAIILASTESEEARLLPGLREALNLTRQFQLDTSPVRGDQMMTIFKKRIEQINVAGQAGQGHTATPSQEGHAAGLAPAAPNSAGEGQRDPGKSYVKDTPLPDFDSLAAPTASALDEGEVVKRLRAEAENSLSSHAPLMLEAADVMELLDEELTKEMVRHSNIEHAISRERQPEAWKLVPRVPTQHMVDAGIHYYHQREIWTVSGIYETMLAASPTPTEGGKK